LIASVTLALADDGLGLRPPVACQRAPDVNLIAREPATRITPDVLLARRPVDPLAVRHGYLL
jgi:hypothetical protein